MTDQNMLLDPATDMLQSFVGSRSADLESETIAIRDQVYAPIMAHKKERFGGVEAFRTLSTCRQRILTRLEKKCLKHSIDFWLAYMRRLPGVMNWESDWIPYATLAV